MEINPFKSDVFSFGLILLELGTLKSPKKGKDLNEWEKIIKKRIKLFKENYVAIIKEPQEKEELNNFIRMLRKCLRLDTNERPDFMRLFYRSLRYCDPENFKNTF